MKRRVSLLVIFTLIFQLAAVFAPAAFATSSVQGPVAPSSVTAQVYGADEDSAQIQWSGVAGAAGYKLYRSKSSGSGYELVPGGTVTGAVYGLVDPAAPGTLSSDVRYYYAVASFWPNGQESALSKKVSVVFKKNTASVPGSLRLTNERNVVSLTWGAAANAVEYRIYRASDKDGPFTQLAAGLSADTTAYVDASFAQLAVPVNSAYYYAVTAVNKYGTETARSGLAGTTKKAPATPGLPVAQLIGDTIQVQWPVVEGVSKFELTRSVKTNGQMVVDQQWTVDGTSYSDVLTPQYLPNDLVYYYNVKSVDEVGNESSASRTVTVVVPKNIAYAPKSVKAVNMDEVVTVSWALTANAVKYNVYRSMSKDGPYQLIADGVPATQDRIVDNSYEKVIVSARTNLYYAVTAINAFNIESSKSSVRVVTVKPPKAPDVFTAQYQNGTIVLNWSDVEDASSYKIYRSTDSKTGFQPVSGPLSATTFVHDLQQQDSPSDIRYYYAISATDQFDNESSLLKKVGVTVPKTIPYTPSKVKAYNNANVINLTWAAAKNAVSYKVYRSTSKDGTYELVLDHVTDLSFQDTYFAQYRVQANTNIYYRVTAVNRFGTESVKSGATYVTIRPAAGPTAFGAQEVQGSVQLVWSPTFGATGYNVYRSTQLLTGYELLNDTPLTAAQFTDTTAGDTIAQDTTYYYAVAFIDKTNHESLLSQKATALVHPQPVAAPSAVSAEAASDRSVTVTWTAAPGAAAYNIYRAAGSAAAVLAGTIQADDELVFTDSSYVQAQLPGGVELTYSVSAVKANGLESAKSAAAVVVLGATSLLTNGDFSVAGASGVAEGWTGDATPGVTGVQYAVNDQQGLGKSQHIQASGLWDGAGALVYQNVAVQSGQPFSLSGQLAVQSADKAKFQLYMDFYDSQNNWVGFTIKDYAGVSAEFGSIGVAGTVPASAVRAKVSLVARGTDAGGTLSADVAGLKLVYLPAAEQEAPIVVDKLPKGNAQTAGTRVISIVFNENILRGPNFGGISYVVQGQAVTPAITVDPTSIKVQPADVGFQPNGQIQLDIPQGAFTDLAGNLSPQVSYSLDAVTAASEVNLITNGSFEKAGDVQGTASGWTKVVSQGATDRTQIVAQPVTSGASAQRIAADGLPQDGVAMIYQYVPIEGARKYALIGDLQVQALNHAKIQLYVDYFTADGQWTGGDVKDISGVTAGYKQVTADLNPPAAASSAKIHVILRATANGGSGEAYLDRLRLLLDTALLTNAGFEAELGGDGSIQGWQTVISPDATGSVQLESEHVPSMNGLQALKVSGSAMSEGSVVMLYQTIPVAGGQRYAMSGNFHVVDLVNAKVQYYIDFYDASGQWAGGTVSEITAPDANVHDYALKYDVFTTPANAASAKVHLILRATGSNGSGLYYADGLDIALYDAQSQLKPAVQAAVPQNDSAQIALNQPVVLTFDKAVTAYDFYDEISVKAGNAAAAIVKSVNGAVLTIQPASGAWEPGTAYTVTLPSGALRDVAGRGTNEAYELHFTTMLDPMGSVLLNGDFEQGADSEGVGSGWQHVVSPGAAAEFAVVSDEHTAGSLAQKITASGLPNDGVAMIYQLAPVSSGQKYNLIGSINAVQLQDAKIQLYVDFFNANNEWVGGSVKELTATTNGFVNVQDSWTTPAGAAFAKVHTILRATAEQASGTIYVDGLSLKADTNLFVNGSFEYGALGAGTADGWQKAITEGAADDIQVVSGPVAEGGKAQQVAATGLANGGVAMVYQTVPVQGGNAYLLKGSFNIATLNDAKVQLYVDFYTADYQWVGGSVQELTQTTNGYAQVQDQLSAPANAALAKVHAILRANGDNAGGVFYVDNMQLQAN
ncbi:Ig-like domain-containing protein [Paenibacillus athensensis]|nr:Ig-like domain-containing protein [Paenibacillus athensensis]MCD1258753.1 Ig-like domain-containing protein [Paenibacillus athensensis]